MNWQTCVGDSLGTSFASGNATQRTAATMKRSPAQKQRNTRLVGRFRDWQLAQHRWERRVLYLLWILAAMCFVLIVIVWWRLVGLA
jgi:hypothetical protein